MSTRDTTTNSSGSKTSQSEFILDNKTYRCGREKSVTVTVVCKLDHFTSISSGLQVLTGVKSGNDSDVSRPVSRGPP